MLTLIRGALARKIECASKKRVDTTVKTFLKADIDKEVRPSVLAGSAAMPTGISRRTALHERDRKFRGKG